MTREELREKRNQTIENLNYIKATLGLDELYIDELEEQNTNLQIMLKAEREVRVNEDYLKHVTDVEAKIDKAKELLKWFVWYFREGSPNLVPYKHKVEETEQFLKDE